MTSGVYKIENNLDGKIYIGSSADIERRWETHKNLLRRKGHYNVDLQQAWDKYGEESFTFEILNVTEYVDLKDAEQDFIDCLDLDENYNKRKYAIRGSSSIQEGKRKNPICIHPNCNRVLYANGVDRYGNPRYRCLQGHSQRVKPTRVPEHYCPKCGKGLEKNREYKGKIYFRPHECLPNNASGDSEK